MQVGLGFLQQMCSTSVKFGKNTSHEKNRCCKIVQKCVLSILDVRRNWIPITEKQLVSFEVECRYVYCGQGVFAFEDKMERSRWRCSSYSQIGVGLIWILWLFIISVPDGLTTISSCTRCINFFKKSSKNSSEPFPCTFLRWVPSVLIGPRHEVCAFDLPLHMHTYMCPSHMCMHMCNTNIRAPTYSCTSGY